MERMTNDTPYWKERLKAHDLISRQAAIDAAERESQVDGAYGYMDTVSIVDMLNELPSAQPEQVIYANMSDKEFEKWLYEHGICNPNVHESIPCDAVPLLIDNAISELLSAQPDCSDCIKHGGDWDCDHVHCHKGESAQPDNNMIHLQKEQAYLQGWEEGRKALRKEIWEDGRDRLD